MPDIKLSVKRNYNGQCPLSGIFNVSIKLFIMYNILCKNMYIFEWGFLKRQFLKNHPPPNLFSCDNLQKNIWDWDCFTFDTSESIVMIL